VFDGEKIFSLAEITALRQRVIRIFSFSKVFAMTGWRIGYLHTDEALAREILKVHDALVTCAPVISQYAAMGALEMGEKDVADFALEYRKRRDLACSKLDGLSDYLSYVRPQGTYYVFPALNPRLNLDKTPDGKIDSTKFALDLLDREQLALVPGAAFGPNGEGHARINFGRSEADINEAAKRLKKYFKTVV